MKRSSTKQNPRRRLLREAVGLRLLLVCVLATAALLFVCWICAGSDRSASEEPAVIQEVFSAPDTTGLPLIKIWTDDGEKPTFSVVDAPDGLLGRSIQDNAYKQGHCTIENLSSMPDFASKMKLKVRGNTSAIAGSHTGKLPYKLILDSSLAMFEDGTTDTRFVLLADDGTDLRTWLGNQIGALCGMEWTIKTRYVNLVLNDAYQGLYLLAEALDGRSLQEHVGDSGLLIESDAYWWKEDVYFHSAYLSSQVAFTLKYPEIEDMQDSRLQAIEAYMERVGENILHGDLEDIDSDTFCAWIIAKDILDEIDSAGSNTYFYLHDFSDGGGSAEQLKMGPLWDFGNTFYHPAYPDRKESWSAFHSSRNTYFPELFNNRTFYALYCSRMKEVCASLVDSCSSRLASLCDELEAAIDLSREADANRWGRGWTPVREEAVDHLQWLSDRIEWIESQLVPITKKNGELTYQRFILDVSDDCETLTIALYDEGYEQVRFPVWSEENGQDDLVWYEAALNDEGFWETVVPLSRHHSAGIYQIHAYATKNGEETLIAASSVYVEAAVESAA